MIKLVRKNQNNLKQLKEREKEKKKEKIKKETSHKRDIRQSHRASIITVAESNLISDDIGHQHIRNNA